MLVAAFLHNLSGVHDQLPVTYARLPAAILERNRDLKLSLMIACLTGASPRKAAMTALMKRLLPVFGLSKMKFWSVPRSRAWRITRSIVFSGSRARRALGTRRIAPVAHERPQTPQPMQNEVSTRGLGRFLPPGVPICEDVAAAPAVQAEK
jgi:hypothetical protein